MVRSGGSGRGICHRVADISIYWAVKSEQGISQSRKHVRKYQPVDVVHKLTHIVSSLALSSV